MLRAILYLMFGTFCAAVLVAILSVFGLHDLDADQIDRTREAFTGLCGESALFALIIGGIVAILVCVGRHIFHLKDSAPRAKLGLCLGIAVSILQYPWDFAVRRTRPEFAQAGLFTYIGVAIVSCAALLLRDNFKQRSFGRDREI